MWRIEIIKLVWMENLENVYVQSFVMCASKISQWIFKMHIREYALTSTPVSSIIGEVNIVLLKINLYFVSIK